MINEQNLKGLYQILSDGIEDISTSTLTVCGFHAKDIATLVEYGVLQREKRGHYSFHDVDNLYQYGTKLFANKEHERAINCFSLCYQLNPTHIEVNQYLLWNSLMHEDFETAFIYFQNIYDVEKQSANADNNLYLYLFSMIMDLPDLYKKRAKTLKYKDIKISEQDDRYPNVSLQNKLRGTIFNQEFYQARSQFTDYINQTKCFSLSMRIIMTFTRLARKQQIIDNNQILKLLQDKKYEDILFYLEKIEQYQKLSTHILYLRKVTKELVSIIQNNQIPPIQVTSTQDVYTAIDGKNYELALSFVSKSNERKHTDIHTSDLYLVLSAIVDEIKKIKATKEHQVEATASVSTSILPSTIENPPTFADITKCLMQQDIDQAILRMKDYLASIDKSQYEILMMNLIKISVMQQDTNFITPMLTLTYISRNTFSFDASEYIQNFYISLSQNQLDEAQVYLDILSRYGDATIVEGLKQILNEKRDEKEQIVEEILDQQPVSQENNVSTERIEKKQEISNAGVQLDVKHKLNQNVKDCDKDFIDQKLDTIYQKGIIVLKPMDTEREKNIHQIVQDIPDISSFSIASDNERRIVLQYTPEIKEYINFGQCAKEGFEAFRNKDYDTCIQLYRSMLETKKAKPFVYSLLGMAYMKKMDISTAIDYLMVATGLSKEDKTNEYHYDYTELIGSLQGKIPLEDRKPKVKMDLSEFNNQINSDYGVTNIGTIAQLISSGINFDEACQTLTEEQKCLVLLIYAREYYCQGNYAKGDMYFKKAERMKNKSAFVKSTMNEIRQNKKFYVNRVEEDYKSYILTPNIQK